MHSSGFGCVDGAVALKDAAIGLETVWATPQGAERPLKTGETAVLEGGPRSGSRRVDVTGRWVCRGGGMSRKKGSRKGAFL